jgi:hypothetical protein
MLARDARPRTGLVLRKREHPVRDFDDTLRDGMRTISVTSLARGPIAGAGQGCPSGAVATRPGPGRARHACRAHRRERRGNCAFEHFDIHRAASSLQERGTVPNVHPKIEDLQRRIVAQLERHGAGDEVIHLWCGYLAALLEWGVIGDDSYNAVSGLLPRVGGRVLLDLFSHAEPASRRNGGGRSRAPRPAH